MTFFLRSIHGNGERRLARMAPEQFSPPEIRHPTGLVREQETTKISAEQQQINKRVIDRIHATGEQREKVIKNNVLAETKGMWSIWRHYEMNQPMTPALAGQPQQPRQLNAAQRNYLAHANDVLGDQSLRVEGQNFRIVIVRGENNSTVPILLHGNTVMSDERGNESNRPFNTSTDIVVGESGLKTAAAAEATGKIAADPLSPEALTKSLSDLRLHGTIGQEVTKIIATMSPVERARTIAIVSAAGQQLTKVVTDMTPPEREATLKALAQPGIWEGLASPNAITRATAVSQFPLAFLEDHRAAVANAIPPQALEKLMKAAAVIQEAAKKAAGPVTPPTLPA